VAKTVEDIAGRERLLLLDAACGDGILRRYLAKRHHYAGVDFSQRPLSRALRRNPGTYFRADLTHLPFESATFDLVVSCQALQYLRQPEIAVSQMARVLKPGGKLFLTVPNSESVKYRLQGISPIQLQRFGPRNIRSLVDTRFDIISVKSQGLWLPVPKFAVHLPGNYPKRWGLSWTVLAALRD
jgi:ubiquinone/menaquinone biosynthesis C-methylase UbiE